MYVRTYTHLNYIINIIIGIIISIIVIVIIIIIIENYNNKIMFNKDKRKV